LRKTRSSTYPPNAILSTDSLNTVIRLTLALPAAVLALILVLPVVVLVTPFWVVRWGVLRFQDWQEPATTPKHRIMQFDPVLGWRARPELDTHVLAEGDDVYGVQTDKEGWPISPAPRVEDAGMIVVGDSFAFGHKARRGEAFFDMARELEIKALGAPGYDMVQECLILREMGARLRDKMVVWLLYVENDITDSLRPHWLGYRKPFVQKPAGAQDWSIASEHLSSERWTASGPSTDFSQFAHLCTPSPFADRHYSACAYLVTEGARICREAGAKNLTLVTIPNVNQLETTGKSFLKTLSPDPDTFDVRYPHQQFDRICSDVGVVHVSGLEHFRATDYKRFERFHWNARGHRRAAELLRQIEKRRRKESPGQAVDSRAETTGSPKELTPQATSTAPRLRHEMSG